MDHPKREVSSKDEVPVLKKVKIDFQSADSGGSSCENLDIHARGENVCASKQTICKNESEMMEPASNKTDQALKLSATSNNSKDCNPCSSNVTTIEAGAAEDKGSRHTMEDAWVVLLDASLDYPGKLRCAHFAVYDGHGGRFAAEYAQKNLHVNVLSAGLPHGYKSCQKGYY